MITDATRKKAAKFNNDHIPELRGMVQDLSGEDGISDPRSQELFSIPKGELQDRFNIFAAAMTALADGSHPNVKALQDGLAIVAGDYKMAANAAGAQNVSLMDRHALDQDVTHAKQAINLMIDIAEEAGVEHAGQYRAGLRLKQ